MPSNQGFVNKVIRMMCVTIFRFYCLHTELSYIYHNDKATNISKLAELVST